MIPHALRPLFRPSLLALPLALLIAATAGKPAAASGRIAIQLTQVLATDSGPGPKEFDPSLEDLKGQLEKYNYRRFKNAGTEKKEVGEGEAATFDLSGEPGFTLRVTPLAAESAITLELLLKDPKGKEVLSTRIKIKDGGTGIVGKELESKEGTLFLAFTVKKKG